MDFLDPKKKRANIIRLFIGYFLMGLVLIIATLVLVFQARGFDVDRKTGAIIQNGLLFVDSHPNPADIYLNGTAKGGTDTRLVLPAGPYDLELRKQGYRTWKRSFNLAGSTIERIVYPFLFPETLDSTDVQGFTAQPGMATESPDRRWILTQQPGTVNNFTLTDTASATSATTPLVVPPEILIQHPGTNSLELVEWSNDNRHVLVKQSFDGGMTFIIIDRQTPAASVNLNTTFAATAFDAVRLRDKKTDQVYLHNSKDATLKNGDLRTATVTPLLSHVLAFQPHGNDVLLYITDEGAPAENVFAKIQQGTTTYTLRQITKGPKYLIDLAQYDNKWYMAIGVTSDPRIYIFKDAFNDLRSSPVALPPYATLRIDNPEYLSISANARFIGVQSGAKFAVHDAETQRSYRYDTQLPLATGQKATWMDGHRYALVSNNKLVVFDYDGINIQTLVDVSPAFIPFFDRDYNLLFTVGPSKADPAKPSLLRTELRTASDR